MVELFSRIRRGKSKKVIRELLQKELEELKALTGELRSEVKRQRDEISLLQDKVRFGESYVGRQHTALFLLLETQGKLNDSIGRELDMLEAGVKRPEKEEKTVCQTVQPPQKKTVSEMTTAPDKPTPAAELFSEWMDGKEE